MLPQSTPGAARRARVLPFRHAPRQRPVLGALRSHPCDGAHRVHGVRTDRVRRVFAFLAVTNAAFIAAHRRRLSSPLLRQLSTLSLSVPMHTIASPSPVSAALNEIETLAKQYAQSR